MTDSNDKRNSFSRRTCHCGKVWLIVVVVVVVVVVVSLNEGVTFSHLSEVDNGVTGFRTRLIYSLKMIPSVHISEQ